MFVNGNGGGGGGGGGGWRAGAVDAFCVCVELLGDWASEKLPRRVQLKDHSPKWRALRNFSFQPCVKPFLHNTRYITFMLFCFIDTETVGNIKNICRASSENSSKGSSLLDAIFFTSSSTQVLYNLEVRV